jgi:hypothetical protein
MAQRIKSIEKYNSCHYETVPEAKGTKRYVDEIKEMVKQLGTGEFGAIGHTIYCGYKNGNLVFEIFAGSDLIITYWEEI